MARPKPWEVDDELLAVIEPLLPKIERRTRHPGRKRHPDRLVFRGILFVLHTGIAREHLPQELDLGSGMTCWHRLAEWTDAGVLPRLHEVLLARLRSANALGFSRAAVDGSHIRALQGVPRPDVGVLLDVLTHVQVNVPSRVPYRAEQMARRCRAVCPDGRWVRQKFACRGYELLA